MRGKHVKAFQETLSWPRNVLWSTLLWSGVRGKPPAYAHRQYQSDLQNQNPHSDKSPRKSVHTLREEVA